MFNTYDLTAPALLFHAHRPRHMTRSDRTVDLQIILEFISEWDLKSMKPYRLHYFSFPFCNQFNLSFELEVLILLK